MLDSIKVSLVLPVSTQRLYEAWLDSGEHSAFTGAAATISPIPGGRYTAWDGYIEGTNVELEPFRRIVQAWRTSDFPSESPDSRLEVLLEEVEGGTRLTLVHTGIPEGQGPQYEQGWVDFYVTPMRDYFAARPGP